jgi:hypothetical protein
MEPQKPASDCPVVGVKPFSDFYRHASDKHYWMLAFASRLCIPDRIMACYIFNHVATAVEMDESNTFFKIGRCSIMELVYAQHYGTLPATLYLVEQACTKVRAAREAGILTPDIGSFEADLEALLKSWLFTSSER